MFLDVFDFNFHRYGIINSCNFVQYEKKINSVGSFQIKCDMNKENLELLKEERIIWFEQDIAGIIQYINETQESDNLIVIKGKLLEEVLNWRCIKETIDISAPINKIMESYVYDNCIKDSERKFDNFEIVYSDFELKNISKQKTGGSVLEGLEELANLKDSEMISFNVGFYPREKKIKFYVKQGMDKTKKTEESNIVVFSKDLKNIIKSEYVKNVENYRNNALVFGEEQNGKRTFISVNDGVERYGYNLKEIYVDARDLQSEYTDENGVEKNMTQEQYMERLVQRGQEKLSENAIIESYDGEIRNDGEVIFIYRKDYNLADKVIIIDKNINLYIESQITSVVVTEDNNGYSVNPVFGQSQPTLLQKILKGRG